VLHGVPFRQAHEVIGSLTAYSIKSGKAFPEMTLEEFQQFSNAFEADVHQVLDLDTALVARKSVGAPSPERVAEQLAKWTAVLT